MGFRRRDKEVEKIAAENRDRYNAQSAMESGPEPRVRLFCALCDDDLLMPWGASEAEIKEAAAQHRALYHRPRLWWELEAESAWVGSVVQDPAQCAYAIRHEMTRALGL